MNPIIVIGMDNTGKTTLVEGLKEAYNNFISKVGTGETVRPFLENSTLREEIEREIDKIRATSAEVIKSPGPLSRKDMYKWCDSEMKRFGSNGKLIIYDRFGSIDEQIYAPIVRGVKELDHVEYLLRNMKYLSWHQTPFIIYARPESDDILGFADGREQMEGVVENGKELLAAYDNLFFKLHTSGDYFTSVYNYRVDTPERLLLEYLDFKNHCLKSYLSLDVKRMIRNLESTTSPLIQTYKATGSRDINILKETLEAAHANLALFSNLWRAIEAQGINLSPEKERALLKTQIELIHFELDLTKKLIELL